MEAGRQLSLKPRRLSVAAVICASLLGVFAGLAWTAVRTKSATYDEPNHVVGGWAALRLGDHRLDPQDPPLWEYWASLPNGRSALRLSPNDPDFVAAGPDLSLIWSVSVRALYQTPGVDWAAVVSRSRMMMLIVGVALGVALAMVSSAMAGATGGVTARGTAAVVTTTLFALDPNFLAYAPLVKNDVVFSLAVLLLSAAVWACGRRLNVWSVLATGAAAGLALCVKDSGILTAPMVLLALLTRAVMREPWEMFGRVVRRSVGRGLVAVASAFGCGAVAWVCVWACYGFRFSTDPAGSIAPGMSILVHKAIENEYAQTHGEPPTESQVATSKPGVFVRAVLQAERWRVLPQPWLTGLVCTYQGSLIRQTFLLGDINFTGHWYYFPVAMLVKTPLATLAALTLAAVWIARNLRRATFAGRWVAVSLGVPFAVYAASALSAHLNLGLRHVLPLYPLMFVATGVVAANALNGRALQTPARKMAAVLAVVLAVESLAAWPNFIPFFNTVAGGSRGGLRILSDSNLDWGQDLPLLADWQRQHEQTPLYLSYFGAADPAAHGIRYTNLPGGYRFGPNPQWPTVPGVLAVSATNLQGTYLDPQTADWYRRVTRKPPIDVLGGSIYLFKYPPK